MDFKNNSPSKYLSIPLTEKRNHFNNDIRRVSEDRIMYRGAAEVFNAATDEIVAQSIISSMNRNSPLGLNTRDQNNLIEPINFKFKAQSKIKSSRGAKLVFPNQNSYHLVNETNSDPDKRDDLSNVLKEIEREKDRDKDRDKNYDRDLYTKNLKHQRDRSKKFLRELGETNFLPQITSDASIGDNINETKKKFMALMDSELENEKEPQIASSSTADLSILDSEVKNKERIFSNDPSISNKNTLFSDFHIKKASKLPSIINKSTSSNPNYIKNQPIVFDFNPGAYFKKKAVRGLKYLPEHLSISENQDYSNYQGSNNGLNSQNLGNNGNNSLKVGSLSPSSGKPLQNQYNNLIPPLQGNTFRFQQKPKPYQLRIKAKEQSSSVNSTMNIIEDEKSMMAKKDDEIEPNMNNISLNTGKCYTSKRVATESDLFAGTIIVRSIVSKKYGNNQNIDAKINATEDEKDMNFLIGNRENAENHQESKINKKTTRNGSLLLQKEGKLNASIALNGNSQADLSEIQKDNDTDIIMNIDTDKGENDIDTPNKQNRRSCVNSAIYNTSNANLMKSVNMAKLHMPNKKNTSIPNKGSFDQKARDVDQLIANKIIMYRDWMLKINFSFNIIVKSSSQSAFVPYKYFIGKGNNRLLIKTLMKQRWWWVPADSATDPNINLLWTQLKQNPFLELLKSKKKSAQYENNTITNNDFSLNSTVAETLSEKNNESATDQSDSDYDINFMKNNKTIQNRMNSVIDPKKKVTKKGISKEVLKDSNIVHLKIMNKADTFLILNYLTNKRKSNHLEDEEELTKINRKQGGSSIINQPNTTKMHNHIENNFHLSNKKAMFYNMRNYCEAIKKNVFDYLPLTFHIQNGIEDNEYKKFLDYYQSKEKEIQEQEKHIEELTKTNDKKALASIKKIRNIWIVKPGENTNRGYGITVCNELNQIKDIISSNELHPNGKKRTYIVQQYIDKPLLYNKRKFDIRCYMMIACINGIIRGYWYQDGYIRTASKEFTLKNVTNRMIHLTNDAVQKKSEEYGKFENGNKLSYSEFQRYLDHVYHDSNINFMNDIYPQMKSQATNAIRSVYGKVDPHKKEHTFEVFGLDFMIDQNFKVWMIEINTNPCLELSSPHLARVIPSMVENALRIAIDPMFPPPNWPPSKKHLLPDNPLENNKFEVVFDELEDGPGLKNMPSSQENNQQLMDQIYEMEEEEEEDSESDEKDEN